MTCKGGRIPCIGGGFLCESGCYGSFMNKRSWLGDQGVVLIIHERSFMKRSSTVGAKLSWKLIHEMAISHRGQAFMNASSWRTIKQWGGSESQEQWVAPSTWDACRLAWNLWILSQNEVEIRVQSQNEIHFLNESGEHKHLKIGVDGASVLDE